MKSAKILILMLLLTATQTFAQDKDLKGIYKDVTTAINSALLTRSGAMELSGNASFNYYSTKYTSGAKMSQYIIRVEPAFLYFMFDNIAIGVDLSYSQDKTAYEESNHSQIIEQTFIGPVAKMYFGDERYRPFIQADYLFLTGDYFDGGTAELGAGLFYHVTGNFGFSLMGKYGYIFSDNPNIDRQTRVFIGIGITSFIL